MRQRDGKRGLTAGKIKSTGTTMGKHRRSAVGSTVSMSDEFLPRLVQRHLKEKNGVPRFDWKGFSDDVRVISKMLGLK